MSEKKEEYEEIIESIEDIDFKLMNLIEERLMAIEHLAEIKKELNNTNTTDPSDAWIRNILNTFSHLKRGHTKINQEDLREVFFCIREKSESIHKRVFQDNTNRN